MLNRTDRWLAGADNALRTLAGAARPRRANPAGAPPADPPPMSDADRRLAGALMRVNHVGEVCAQALYQGQALASKNSEVIAHHLAAAQEEADHLAWTEQRLRELDARPSLLNPLWYAGAFGIGYLAARVSDGTSLGFVVETERQVEAHLAGHLERLPAGDERSRAIVAAMQADERRHADEAEAAGAAALPRPLAWLMRGAAKLMTTTAHRI
jgi:ubiquinone biosynthesis monooxygenase Coq7